MPVNFQLIWLFVLSIPIACISWTVTKEEVFKEPRDYCLEKSKTAKYFIVRKICYLLTCEYCFSHYVTIGFIFFTNYTLLLGSWKGYVIAGFSLVWIANLYMSIFGLLRQDIKKIKTEIGKAESDTKN